MAQIVNNVKSALIDFLSLSQGQIAFLGPLEWRYLFGSKDKVFNHQKLVFKSGVWFLFVLTGAILLNLNLQKRTSSDIKLPSQKLFVQQKWCLYPKFTRVFYILDIKVILCSVMSHSRKRPKMTFNF